MPKQVAVPVTTRALLQRINRKLAPDEVVKASRGGPAQKALGAYYRVDMEANAVNEKKIVLADLGRRLGVLQPWETLVEE